MARTYSNSAVAALIGGGAPVGAPAGERGIAAGDETLARIVGVLEHEWRRGKPIDLVRRMGGGGTASC